MTDSTYPSLLVSIDWLAAHHDDPKVLIVDVRPKEHYAAGHIPGSVSIDLYPIKILDSDPELIDRWVREIETAFRAIGIDHDKHVVFYEDISGTTAARGVWLMHALSIGDGAMLDGGLNAWQATGGAVSTKPVQPNPSSVTAELDRTQFAVADDFLAASENRVTILDTRAALEWMQGTIPTAQHLEWVHHLQPDGTLKPLDQLRELYAPLDSADGEVITFCASGYRAAHTWLVLRMLGYASVKNYAPSWGEWSRRNDLPVAKTR